jgi:hypothetical protein
MMSTGMPIKDMQNIVYDIYPEGLDRSTVNAVCNALYSAGYRQAKDILYIISQCCVGESSKLIKEIETEFSVESYK